MAVISSYRALWSQIAEKNIIEPTIKDVSEAVMDLRQSKLPDPKEIGNSGSFFKNPIVSKKTFKNFQKKNPASFELVREWEFLIKIIFDFRVFLGMLFKLTTAITIREVEISSSLVQQLRKI